jgi:capsular polysaccharide biosynthesis protein
MAALAPLGFELVTLSPLSLREQAALVAGAGWIVAPHGAGLANLAYATRGARVLELFASSYGTSAFALLADGARLGHDYLVSDDLLAADDPQFQNFRVDVAAVVAALGRP